MGTSTSKRALAAQKRARAMRLRLGGMDWESIAARVGYASKGAACTAVTRAFQAAVADVIDAAEQLRPIELARLDAMQSALWPAAMDGDPEAVRVILRVMDRRAKLTGLDAPKKVQQIITSQLDAEIAALIDAVGDLPT